jgi:EmrB/QacA subfamily drug resistance transporter
VTVLRPEPVLPAAVEQPYARRWPALFILLMAQVMDLADAAIIGVAGPSIQADLGSGYTQLQWFAAAYTLTFAVGLITGGRLGDIHGRRRILTIGVVGFAVCSVACGLAANGEMLIGCRAVQGAFAAIMIPQQFGIIKGMFPGREMAKAFAALSPVIGLTTVLAPVAGGALVHADLFGLGWRSVFLINVPIAVLLFVGLHAFVPESRSRLPLRLDLVGTVLVTVGAALLMVPLVQGRETGWPPVIFVSMAAGALVLAVFWRYEVRKHQRDGSSLLVPTLFRKRSFPVALLVGLLFFAALQGFLFAFGLYLQLAAGRSPLDAGLTLIPWSVGSAIGSAIGAGLARRFGRRVLQTGMLLMAAGVAGLAITLRITKTDFTAIGLMPFLVAAGLGMGLLLAPFLDIVLWGVSQDEVGAASGVFNSNEQLGSAAGLAVLGTVFFAQAEHTGYGAAIDRVLWIGVVMLVVACALTLLLPRARNDEDH